MDLCSKEIIEEDDYLNLELFGNFLYQFGKLLFLQLIIALLVFKPPFRFRSYT